MTKPKVPKASKKSTKRATKNVRKPTAKREKVTVTMATETFEAQKFTEDEISFPANSPVGTMYRPTGAKSSWIKQDEVSWKEVKDE